MPLTKNRYRPGTSVWFVAGLILLTALIVAVLVMRPWTPRYRRFISQPLPDGSRYTFLYPAHLQNLQENGKGASPEVTGGVNVWTMNQSVSQWGLILGRLGFSVTSPAESVTVVVIPLKSKPVKDSHRTERWERSGGLRQNTYLVDARTRTQYFLYHSCPSTARDQFERHRPVIERSFRVLPPDPKPSPP
jgi:hypothetical protein